MKVLSRTAKAIWKDLVPSHTYRVGRRRKSLISKREFFSCSEVSELTASSKICSFCMSNLVAWLISTNSSGHQAFSTSLLSALVPKMLGKACGTCCSSSSHACSSGNCFEWKMIFPHSIMNNYCRSYI